MTDFTPISMIATVPSLLVGNPALPAQDLAALIALAKAKPDGDPQVAARCSPRLQSKTAAEVIGNNSHYGTLEPVHSEEHHENPRRRSDCNRIRPFRQPVRLVPRIGPAIY